MPPHSSHLLQPLDVVCFSQLKRAYGDQINHLIRSYINYVTKLKFLLAFCAAYLQSIIEKNICSSFRAAGLVPYNPEAVLSKLDVKLRTPSPLLTAAEAPWESQTPSNARELGAQSTLVREKIQRY
jgi:hypothetical protein